MIVKKPSPLERAAEFSYPPREWEEYRTALWYHEQSKFGKRKSEKDFVHIGQLRQNPSLVASMTKHFKIYPDVEYMSLPSVVDLFSEKSMSLEEAIVRRRSVRSFSKQVMPFDVFARLLVFSYGITGEMPYDTGDVQYLRASPSAGALYPLEVYPVVFRVEGLEPGLYHYAVRKNAIGLLKKGDFSEFLVSLWTEQQMVRDACVMFFLTAYPLRTLRKYRERGLRFLYLDAGHMAEHLYLLATAYGFGACALGGAYDREVEKWIGIDGLQETLLYGVVVG